MLRVPLVAVIVASVRALLFSRDAPEDVDVDGSGVAGTLDPELTNVRGEKFHVTKEGEYLMIGLPANADMTRPEEAELLIEANFSQVGSNCDDLLIRKITLEGTSLGNGLNKLEFFVANDLFNDTGAIGLTATDDRGVPQTYDVQEFSRVVPECEIVRPRGYIHPPTRKSWRKRTTTYHATLNLNGQHEVNIFWATVWRGISAEDGKAVYKNDLSFSVSGVGDSPGGLLGNDDNKVATPMVPGCFKPQPVGGPYQQRSKFGARGKAHLFR